MRLLDVMKKMSRFRGDGQRLECCVAHDAVDNTGLVDEDRQNVVEGCRFNRVLGGGTLLLAVDGAERVASSEDIPRFGF